jgi:hypothetical protein
VPAVLLDHAPTLTVAGEDATSVAVTATPLAEGWAWQAGNDGPPAAVRAVRATWDLGPSAGPVRVWCHGWQSWSACRTAVLGVDGDPAGPAVHPLLRQLQHADPDPPPPGELRSESVVLLARPGRPLLCVGALGGTRHDTTFRLRLDDRDHVLLTAEAVLGGAVLGRGETRPLHAVVAAEGDDPHDLLAWWAERVGTEQRARTSAPYQVGWCSWYHWFTDVTEADLAATVARAPEWPFDVIQLDDGYQHDIGDWLETNETFPSGVPHIAETITASGRTAGLWLAPFLAMGGSRTATAHPGWLARWHDGRPLIGNHNPAWGGSALALDVTHPEVLAHLEHVAAELVGMGPHQGAVEVGVEPAGVARQALAGRGRRTARRPPGARRGCPARRCGPSSSTRIWSAADGGQAVGDHDGRAAGERLASASCTSGLVLGVEVAGGLVEDDDGGSFSSMRAMASRCFSPPDSR